MTNPRDRFGPRPSSHRRPEDWPPEDPRQATIAVPVDPATRLDLPPIDDTDPRGQVPSGYADQGYDTGGEWIEDRGSGGPGRLPRGWNEDTRPPVPRMAQPEPVGYGRDPSGRLRRELVVPIEQVDPEPEPAARRRLDVPADASSRYPRRLVDPELNRLRVTAARLAIARDVVLLIFLLVGTLYLVLAIRGVMW